MPTASAETMRCETEMPIRRYITSQVFTPEALSAMGEAFQGAVAALEIPDEDETRREAVAQFIIHLALSYRDFDAGVLRDKAIKSLGGKIEAWAAK
jgi:hypothetical protein